ncbi:unnamed protein product, partial [Larinioides sclopetarius]
DICKLPGSYGNCTAIVSIWFHEVLDHTCRPFKYSGCGGNSNRFATYEDCYKTCLATDRKREATTAMSTFNTNRKKSTIDLESHAIVISNDDDRNNRENRNVKKTTEKGKSREDINRKNKNKSGNANRTGRIIKRNYRRQKSRIRDGERPVNIKKNMRKSTTNTKNENKRRNYRKQQLKFRMAEKEKKAKTRQSKRENRVNCRQQHGRTGGKNKTRNHCLHDKRTTTEMKNNSSTERNRKRTGRRRTKKGKEKEKPF